MKDALSKTPSFNDLISENFILCSPTFPSCSFLNKSEKISLTNLVCPINLLFNFLFRFLLTHPQCSFYETGLLVKICLQVKYESEGQRISVPIFQIS